MSSREKKARHLVHQYLNENKIHVKYHIDEILLVWFSKTLKNWKALVIADRPDDMYYEVTYNGDKNEAYIDAYKKIENVVIPD